MRLASTGRPGICAAIAGPSTAGASLVAMDDRNQRKQNLIDRVGRDRQLACETRGRSISCASLMTSSGRSSASSIRIEANRAGLVVLAGFSLTCCPDARILRCEAGSSCRDLRTSQFQRRLRSAIRLIGVELCTTVSFSPRQPNPPYARHAHQAAVDGPWSYRAPSGVRFLR